MKIDAKRLQEKIHAVTKDRGACGDIRMILFLYSVFLRCSLWLAFQNKGDREELPEARIEQALAEVLKRSLTLR